MEADLSRPSRHDAVRNSGNSVKNCDREMTLMYQAGGWASRSVGQDGEVRKWNYGSYGHPKSMK